MIDEELSASYCWDCKSQIYRDDDDASVCIDCGGRNRRVSTYLLGVFTVTDREMALYEKAEQYVKATENLDRKQGYLHSRAFSDWCKERGFTHREMIDAKHKAGRLDLIVNYLARY